MFNEYLHTLDKLLTMAEEMGFEPQAVANDIIIVGNIPGRGSFYKKAQKAMGLNRIKIESL